MTEHQPPGQPAGQSHGQPPGGPPGGPRPPTKKRTGLIVGLLAFVVVVGVLAVAAFVLVPRSLNDDSEAVSGGPGAANEQADPADPVDTAAVEEVLVAQGFECFESVTEPVQVRTCYRTEEDGATMDVQIQAEPSGDVRYVGITAASDIYWRGDAAAGFPPVYESVGEVLVKDATQELPSLELEGEDHLARADIGGVHLRLQRDGTDETELQITGLAAP